MTNHPNTVTWQDYARAVENYNAEREKANALANEVERLRKELEHWQLTANADAALALQAEETIDNEQHGD